jgi:hypothetical protein
MSVSNNVQIDLHRQMIRGDARVSVADDLMRPDLETIIYKYLVDSDERKR